ncbi:MAG: ATP-binding cassette domain-containing protein [Chloroflexales bacterium]|nr:ATP-binding cassette domain-containing protein [Chloroflexales bacterium]
MTVRALRPFYSKRQAMQAVDLDVRPNEILAMIGPSGCGKTTLLRAINRMHDTTPGARAEGGLTLDGDPIYGPDVDPTATRSRWCAASSSPTPQGAAAGSICICASSADSARLCGASAFNVGSRREEESLRRDPPRLPARAGYRASSAWPR